MKWTNILPLWLNSLFLAACSAVFRVNLRHQSLKSNAVFSLLKNYLIAQYLAFSSVGVTIDGQSLCFNCIIIMLLNGVDHQVLENF